MIILFLFLFFLLIMVYLIHHQFIIIIKEEYYYYINTNMDYIHKVIIIINIVEMVNLDYKVKKVMDYMEKVNKIMVIE